MGAAIYDFEIEQGADLSLSFTWTDENSVPIDISGYSARMKIKETLESTTNIASLTSTLAAGITLGGAAGTIDIAITAAVTATYNFTSAVYDLEMIDGSGTVTRLLKGTVTLDKEVTT